MQRSKTTTMDRRSLDIEHPPFTGTTEPTFTTLLLCPILQEKGECARCYCRSVTEPERSASLLSCRDLTASNS